MKNSLPYLTLVGLLVWCPLAQAQPESPSATSPAIADADRASEGDALIRAAVLALHQHDSIAANVRQQLNLFGNRLVGAGVYYQEGRGAEMLVRFELRTHIAGRECSLQQVADGRYLWTDEQFDHERSIRKVDLRRVQKALSAQETATGSAARLPLAVGGVPRLIERLAMNFHFGPPNRIQLGDLPAYALEGTWRPDRLGSLTAGPGSSDDSKADAKEDAAAKSPNLASLPHHVPHEVLLVLGQEDLFPHVVEYRRLMGTPPGAGGRETLVRLELYQVRTGEPIDNRQFLYRSSETNIADHTDQFLRQNGLVDARLNALDRARRPDAAGDATRR
ncbi:MAG: hypothetical protein WDZ59_05025 [Pirellulales bacterium]